MHVIFRESHGLDEADTPQDLGQTPADLVVLSFSDSDLGAFAEGWHRARGDGFQHTLRLANLGALKHPLSVDTYIEQTLDGTKGILIRLIGGVPYWSYGLQQLGALAQEKGIALAVLPADGRDDPQLDEISTVPTSTLKQLRHLCEQGGAMAAQAALAQLALAAGLYAAPVIGQKTLPDWGAWTPEKGAFIDLQPVTDAPCIVISFYRAYLAAADMAPVHTLFSAFRAKGYHVVGVFAPSLKVPKAAAWIEEALHVLKPVAIVNVTSFSGLGGNGRSPLDVANVPVFQAALSTSNQKAWAEAERGLSPADLAMHVVLPEVDGRLTGGVISFKEPGVKDTDLEFARWTHCPDPKRVDAIVNRVHKWIELGKDASGKRLAFVLSTYPGKDWQMAHAVGMDPLASVIALLPKLRAAGFDVSDAPNLSSDLQTTRFAWPISDYLAALASLPETLRGDLLDAWGDPADDPTVSADAFQFSVARFGKAMVALQPERGNIAARDEEYHDLARTPRHSYVAFYLWLQSNTDALIHMGAHGTLEWLPGKSVALSDACWPEALIGASPVIYPFIVNDPGEAAQAKRRIGALTLGHVPPPMRASDTPDRMVRLEALLDEFSNADGLDPKRRDRLQSDIRDEAQAIGLEDELGLDRAACVAEAITRIDSFVCDIKESQFGDGLHIFGEGQCGENELSSLIDALSGKRIAPGPSGSPYRGRTDVLPTGRNLFTTDPRSVPTRAAYAQGVKLAEELVRRHLQDHGDYPRGLVVDLWGSATMRTAGEEFAMALHLLGVRPIWDTGSERVSGIEVLPIAELSRPRLDVTLRVSGLFRDVFPTLSTLFAQATRALAARDEAPDWNPFAGHTPTARVFGPKPGQYGLGMDANAETFTPEARQAAGAAWLNASSWSFDGAEPAHLPDQIAARVRKADGFVHLQDLPETDLLLAADYAAHEAGFAAAQSVTGGHAALYHVDNTDPAQPRARALREEIARVVHARASNPNWIAGMQRHGFRGGAEIAATLDHMAAFAHLAGAVPAHLFDLYYDATLGNDHVTDFLENANPGALQAMRDQFAALDQAGLWVTRRNSIRAAMEVSV